MIDLSDTVLIALYEGFSEGVWASGFANPDRQAVEGFRIWLARALNRTERESYELDMLQEYRRQEEKEFGTNPIDDGYTTA